MLYTNIQIKTSVIQDLYDHYLNTVKQHLKMAEHAVATHAPFNIFIVELVAVFNYKKYLKIIA